MQLRIVPCLADNYAFLLLGDRVGIVVDPSESAPVLKALEHRNLVAILLTHHHHDHVGGVDDLCAMFPEAKVYCHAHDVDRTPGKRESKVLLEDGAQFDIEGQSFIAMHVPGHTLGALTYVTDLESGPHAFTGDTLFIAGCGRLFEGSPAQMLTSMQKLAALPGDTKVCCGHEYTLSNLKFAAYIEPQNQDIQPAIARANEMRNEGLPTVASAMSIELKTNPFMRVSEPSYARFGDSHVERFGKIRELKNAFK
jgi:hydroxyacylglutathione hydrolase